MRLDKQTKIPPSSRSPIWQTITNEAGTGKLLLQVCGNCNATQYPPRELCKDCLHDELEWREISSKGTVISHTILHASTNDFFRENGPRQITLIKLDGGTVMFAHVANVELQVGDKVNIVVRRDMSGEGVYIALLDSVEEEKQLSELSVLLTKENE